MRHRSRILGALIAAVTVTIASVSPASAHPQALAAPGRAPAPKPSARQQSARTVSLITGDRVTSYGSGRLSVQPRSGVTFLTYRNKDHQYVIPSDALALLRADRLDPRLFDVTGLLESGYDRRADVPLIVAGGAAPKGFTAQRSLPAVRGYATKLNRASLAKSWSATKSSLTTGKVWLDGMRKPALDVSVPQIGAPVAWAAGYDGTGVKVAVLDTGIDATHPDLAGAVAAEQNFAAEEEDARDHVGHGTHVASTIAGSGVASGGRYRGVAPGATLLDGKICVTFGCAESWILAGMQWAAESGADVVNMSLGGPDSLGIDPIEQAVNDLTARYGALFVVAAGNDGADESVGSPASADAALAVGAVDKSDQYAPFSSRGPRLGDHAIKPEITAPGVDIVAAKSRDSDDGPAADYVSHSGTSMATPHVAGAAAILTQVHPQWTAEQRKAVLMASAKPNPAIDVFAQGAGRVDVARAYLQTITTTPTAVSLGLQEFPHDDDQVLTRTVTYHNPTTSAVTLNLALTTTAPGGMFALSASAVTVPAGADASVDIAADTRIGGAATGTFGGQITATAAGVSVQTPFGIVRDVQRAKVHITTLNRAGKPGTEMMTVLLNPTTFTEYRTFEPDATLAVIPGTYFAFSFVSDVNESSDLVAYPSLQVNQDQSVVMDGRLARGYDITVPNRDASSIAAIADLSLSGEHFGIDVSLAGDSWNQLYSVHLGPKNVPGLASTALGAFAKKDASGAVIGSPYSYTVGWYQPGEAMTGLVRHVRERDLATVRADYRLDAPGAQASRINFSVVPGVNGGWGFGLPIALPAERTEYFAGTLSWQPLVEQYLPSTEPNDIPTTLTVTFGETTTYVASQNYAERWNNAVFAPNLASPPEAPAVLRHDNDMAFFPSLHSDASGRSGFPALTKAHAALYRDGQLVGESGDPGGVFTVPPQSASYRLEVSEELVPELRLSTKVECVWTFTSARSDQDVTPLPLTGLGFAASLDERNTAKAGSVAITPVVVSAPQGSGAGRLTKLSVDVSYDDGGSWQKAAVINIAGRWLVVYQHRNKPGYVSLRAQGTDSAANTVKETIIRAYELR